MKLRVSAVLAAVIAAGAAASPGAGAGSAGDGRVPTRVGVRGAEFSLGPSRIRVAPGPAVVQFHNAGEDPHDLRMRRLDATPPPLVPRGRSGPTVWPFDTPSEIGSP